MQEVVLVILICVFSFLAGKLSVEKKVIEDEIKRYAKGAAAGDRAVKSYKLRKQKQQ